MTFIKHSNILFAFPPSRPPHHFCLDPFSKRPQLNILFLPPLHSSLHTTHNTTGPSHKTPISSNKPPAHKPGQYHTPSAPDNTPVPFHNIPRPSSTGLADTDYSDRIVQDPVRSIRDLSRKFAMLSGSRARAHSRYSMCIVVVADHTRESRSRRSPSGNSRRLWGSLLRLCRSRRRLGR